MNRGFIGALCLSVTFAFLVGCSGSPSVGAVPRGDTVGVRRGAGSTGDLLYVTGDPGVFVLSYPQGQMLSQFQPPDVAEGVCSDGHGNVFVTAGTNTGHIYEYAHGGTTPIATLDDDGYTPVACAIDPSTGNLAVINGGGRVVPNSVAIYQSAQGSPTVYSDPNIDRLVSCTFNNSGDLFVLGRNEYQEKSHPNLAELPNGGNALTDIALKAKVEWPGSIQWTGSYLALSAPKVVYHVTVSGSTGTVIGKTRLKGLKSPWTLDSGTLISLYGHADGGYPYEVAYWHYPKGGAPTQVLNSFGKFSRLNGLSISVPGSH